MAEEIVIDKTTFFDRLSSFYTQWKADKKSGAGLFGGVGSIVILMGKTEEANAFQKSNAMHVSFFARKLSGRRLIMIAVLAPRLRVPRDAHGIYDGGDVCCDHGKEGYVLS